MTQKLFILSFNSYKRLGYLHRQLEGFTPTLSLSSYLIIPVIFITAKSFSPFLKSPTWLPTKFPTLIVGNQLPIKDNVLVFNHFPFRHITDMSPTFISDIYIGITATITAKKKFTATKQYQTSAYTDQLLN